MGAGKEEINIWNILAVLVIIALVALATWNYFNTQKTVQFSNDSGCPANQAKCNDVCQTEGLTCSQCPADKPFRFAFDVCKASPV